MNRLLKGFVKSIDLIINVSGIIASLLILAAAGMVFYEIVSRSFFNAPTIWSSELSVYAVIGSAYFGAAYALKEDSHITVDFLKQRLKSNHANIINVLILGLGLIFSVILFKTGLDMVGRSYQIDLRSASVLRIPMYIPHLMVPLGALLLVLGFIQKIILSFIQQTEENFSKGGAVK